MNSMSMRDCRKREGGGVCFPVQFLSDISTLFQPGRTEFARQITICHRIFRPSYSFAKGGFKSEETGRFLLLQDKYSKLLSWAENLNFPPKTINNLFKFSAQDSDLKYLSWRSKNSPVSSDSKPPLCIVHVHAQLCMKLVLEKW